MGDNVNDKVAIATGDDLEWARARFGFVWGKSSLAQRLRAVELLIGSQVEVIRLAGLAASTYKSVLSRQGDMASERIGALAHGTGLTLAYLIFGEPGSDRDVACEEKRFDLAVKEFALPSGASRREARLLVIAEQRAEVDAQLEAAQRFPQFEDAWVRGPIAPLSGFALIAPLLPTTHVSGRGHYSTAEPAPLALSIDWLKARGVALSDLRYLEILGDEGGTSLPAGSLVFVDISQTAAKSGALFAMDYGGEAQLRRLIRTRAGTFELTHINPTWPTDTVSTIADVMILGQAQFHLSARSP